MDEDKIDTFLAQLTVELSKLIPEDAEHAAEFADLMRKLEERDEAGNPTRDAHRAKARLSNVFHVEESTEKTRQKVDRQYEKAFKNFAGALSEAIRRYGMLAVYQHQKKRLEEYEQVSVSRADNRLSHDPESRFALAQPFIDKLSAEQVSPSGMGRLPRDMAQVIALLIKEHTRDPKLEDRDNIWNRMARFGVLEFYRKNLDDGHLRLIAQAASARDIASSEWAERACATLDLPEGMEDCFLEGAARLADATRTLTPGEGEAYYDAYRLQPTLNIELLARVLGLDAKADYAVLQAIVDFVKQSRSVLQKDFRFAMNLAIMKQEIDMIAPHQKWHKDWKKELIERLHVLAERLEPMGSVEAFNAVLKAGLGASEAQFAFVKRLERDVLDGKFIALENQIRAACKAPGSFKIHQGRVIRFFEEVYDEIEEVEWSGEEWIEAYGCLPGDDEQGQQATEISAAEVIGPDEKVEGDGAYPLASDRETPERETDLGDDADGGPITPVHPITHAIVNDSPRSSAGQSPIPDTEFDTDPNAIPPELKNPEPHPGRDGETQPERLTRTGLGQGDLDIFDEEDDWNE